jgi:hypothetical protein
MIIVNSLKLLKKYFIYLFAIFEYLLINHNRKIRFENDYEKLENLLKKNINFAFTRFSDGELYMMKNYKIQITTTDAFLGNKKLGSADFTKEEVKLFDPEQHQFYREKLFESFYYDSENYFKGIACSCCNGKKEYKYMLQLAIDKKLNLNRLTFSNLFMNANYSKFINRFLKIIESKKVILVLSKYADLSDMPFKIKKTFRVGENCMINDYDIVYEILHYVKSNNIKDHVFMMSAATLSNFLIHQLYKNFPQNTYLDIGSSLNPFFKMKGWKGSRRYLQEYWLNAKPQLSLNRNCYW